MSTEVPVTPVTPAAPVTALKTPPAADPATPPQYVTAEQYNALLSRIDGLSGKISVVERNKVVPETKNDVEEKTLKEQFAAFRKERDDANAQIAIERRENQLLAAVNGVPDIDDEAREILLAHIEKKYGANIKVEGKNVFYIAPDQSQKDLKALMGEVMQGVGKRFVKAPNLPSANGLNGGGNKGSMPGTKPTYQQLMSDPKLLAQWQEWDSDFVIQEQNKALAEMRVKK